ncbi:unnamed protein product [Gulo gulo]|uniref:Uncharacterized protein n=1 Tax=Gulo gulo TaxID=48420 RepID=A0A9X9LFP4_GULGU|nr:unnamed protein product [Gulo gulo]
MVSVPNASRFLAPQLLRENGEMFRGSSSLKADMTWGSSLKGQGFSCKMPLLHQEKDWVEERGQEPQS